MIIYGLGGCPVGSCSCSVISSPAVRALYIVETRHRVTVNGTGYGDTGWTGDRRDGIGRVGPVGLLDPADVFTWGGGGQ